MIAGMMGSSRFCAVSTRMRKGPFGQSTAIKSQMERAPNTVQLKIK
jgi:hypothetical protein